MKPPGRLGRGDSVSTAEPAKQDNYEVKVSIYSCRTMYGDLTIVLKTDRLLYSLVSLTVIKYFKGKYNYQNKPISMKTTLL